MDKRLAKRHKRQVARKKENVKLSEPDLRSPEEIKAAREASRPAGGRVADLGSASSTATSRTTHNAVGTGSAAKTSV